MRLLPEQEAEIERQRGTTYSTRRATVTGIEDILYTPFPVLDHGFVRVIDYMGDDSAIVQSARVSYGRGTKKVQEDKGLINYLMRHRHTTPFEMCEIKFHVKMPIFIARQWIRHRTANVNEYSARYSIMDKEYYIPSADQMAVQSNSNRQGRGDILSPEKAAEVMDLLKADAEQCYGHYEDMIDEEGTGLARELARMNLTLNTYTQWYWKIDLHNLMHFLSLRADHHAQYEIRVYAEQMLDILKRWVPLTHEAFMQYRMGGVHVSAGALDVVKALLKGEKVQREDTPLSKREWNELMEKIDRADLIV